MCRFFIIRHFKFDLSVRAVNIRKRLTVIGFNVFEHHDARLRKQRFFFKICSVQTRQKSSYRKDLICVLSHLLSLLKKKLEVSQPGKQKRPSMSFPVGCIFLTFLVCTLCILYLHNASWFVAYYLIKWDGKTRQEQTGSEWAAVKAQQSSRWYLWAPRFQSGTCQVTLRLF